MVERLDFPGGITPPTRKARATRAPLREAARPARVVLPLAQHAGAPAEPCVRVGQRVRTGEPVARAAGLVSAEVHASVTGRVAALEERPLHDGSRGPCVVIDAEGEDDWWTLPSLDWRATDDDALLARLDASGVVGLGGAAFPAQVKARIRELHEVDTLVVNAAECEPYISADDLLLRHHAAEVLEGARMMARLAGAARILVGIEDDKPEALAALEAALAASGHDDTPAEIRVIATRYPSGGERQLIKRLLGREVPSGGLPADVGAHCHNPGTLRAALAAVRDGRPLVERVVTLTGEALARPGNVVARLGTPIAELLEDAGLARPALHRLVMGGPMMGRALGELDLPVVKATNCLIAATREELPDPPPEQPCIRCGACEEACPAGLLPQQLYWFARGREHDKAERFHLFDCIECGACDYVCPSHIPLAQYFRAGKDAIRARRREAARADHARHRFEFRQARLAREAAEKEARRAARKQAAARPRRRPAGEAQPAEPAADLRGLRIAETAARAAERKAQKALTRAAEGGEQDPAVIADLETQLATARENLQAAEARLQAARDAEEKTP
ncbi:electron transport complex subunit RsxC [Halomonas koreensis]|uniref:Ion-translocating oxidoreductase complex subunit C n=1 Tax=Halomonas koreensis TaxID=245385 RepID=A0ABU1FZB4_9GAMM|nr:electron transport complex subunit RsxC [Halomonas koreensis]MDR5866017.1 electron transport complex subunit RsxC [Halomonas koreensis]